MDKRIPVPDLAPPAVEAGSKGVRRRSTWLLLHLIQIGGPSSQTELARRSGLSWAPVCGILQPLIRKRILVQERNLQCMRTREKPNCDIELAYRVQISLIMAMMSFTEGKVAHFDAATETIRMS